MIFDFELQLGLISFPAEPSSPHVAFFLLLVTWEQD